MPKVDGVLETALYVEDLERSVNFYHTIFGFETIDSDPKRLTVLKVASRQVLLLFKKGATLDQNVSGSIHLAFSIATSDLGEWEKWLQENKIAIEIKQSWKRGGQSLYFRDPDQNMLELATPGVWSIY